MQIKYVVFKKIDNWLVKHKVFDRKLAKRMLARILRIDIQSIRSVNIRNRCVNVFTKNSLYKCQFYGGNIKKDLSNRKMFSVYLQEALSPIKVYRKFPPTIMMPILKPSIENETAACDLLDQLKKYTYETAFMIADYPLIVDGLAILKDHDGGRRISKILLEYLQKQQGLPVHAGIVHGDFHRDNIMSMGNKSVLIDFDCSRKNDIWAIDALYYILEEVRHKNGYKKTWLEEWLFIYENMDIVYEYKCAEKIDIDIRFGLIVLLLERISQDQRFDYCFIDANKSSIKKISRKLISDKYL